MKTNQTLATAAALLVAAAATTIMSSNRSPSRNTAIEAIKTQPTSPQEAAEHETIGRILAHNSKFCKTRGAQLSIMSALRNEGYFTIDQSRQEVSVNWIECTTSITVPPHLYTKEIEQQIQEQARIGGDASVCPKDGKYTGTYVLTADEVSRNLGPLIIHLKEPLRDRIYTLCRFEENVTSPIDVPTKPELEN